MPAARPIVALDIETTGLEPTKDAIIEIGVIRVKGERTEEKSWLINPGRKLTPFITQLTGISDAMLTNAPRLAEVLPLVEDFVGDAPVIGHNIKFDLSFLRAKNALRFNDGLDTYDLASVLLPTAGRYNLGALGKLLGIIFPATHRALDDCRVTVGLYRALFRKALELPLELLAEIVNVGQHIEWGAGLIFEEALAARSREKAARPYEPQFARSPLPDERPLQRKETLQPLEVNTVAALLEPGGPFAKKFPGYEPRAEQVQMLRAIVKAFNEGRHLFVEAGTGTGKSVGYLIPAIHWAMQNQARVVVSTNTINLQEQLVHKDLPDLQAALNLNFRAALLKGRSNYLCPRRLDNLRYHGPKTADEMRVLAKVLVWLHEQHGNPATATAPTELSLGPNERFAWMRLSAEDEGCTTDTCQSRMNGTCPFYRARKAAQAAHIIVVNHALLMADIATENRVIPDYGYLVVDEAHHLETAATDGLSFEVSAADLERRLKDLGSPTTNLLGQALTSLRTTVPPDWYVSMEKTARSAYDHATNALQLSRAFFEAVGEFLAGQRAGESEYNLQVRIVPNTRKQPHWEQVELRWDDASQSLKPLVTALNDLAGGLQELAVNYEIAEHEEIQAGLHTAAQFFSQVVTNVQGLITKPDPALIYWAEAQSNGNRVLLHAAPLHVGPLIEKHLWNAKESIIMASATLTTAGEFDYVRGRLTARQATELAVGSPFNYETSTLLYLVNDIPEPQMRNEYQKAVERALITLCTETRGRALVLFTSYAQLKQTAQVIRDPLARAGVDVYDQSGGSSRSALLDSFKTSEGGVLLGTKSFWEGVDVPGEALSVLVIVKLPFDVPTDPIVAARSETFEQPFNAYNVPEAILKFRQGFGRLIRSRSDRGVVVILDRRVLTKGYGRLFLDSLPTCTVRQAPLANLPKTAAQWIDG